MGCSDDHKERCLASGETWKPPSERVVEKRAKVLSLYGKTVIDQRLLKPQTRIDYEAKWTQLIEPKLGRLAVRDLTTTAVRGWYSGLDPKLATRNSHAYGVLNMICNTAVKNGLLDRNPCQIVGAMNPKPKKKVKIPTTVELHAIAGTLGDDNTARLAPAHCRLRCAERAAQRACRGRAESSPDETTVASCDLHEVPLGDADAMPRTCLRCNRRQRPCR